MRIAVVGAGPAGSSVSMLLARDGAVVTLFDHSFPREKPCGGGLTPAALALLPGGPEDDPLRLRRIETCRLEPAAGKGLEVRLGQPLAIVSRAELDGWLLRRALATGVSHVAERVVHVEESGKLHLASGRDQSYDLVIGADGAGSQVRRCVRGTTASCRMMVVGWYSHSDAPMTIRFLPDLGGYLWLFPRLDHVAVGLAAPLGSLPSRLLVARLRRELRRTHPELVDTAGPLYAHTIAVPSEDPSQLRGIAGSRWALLGDAAGLADPITGEGLQYALRSAQLLASTLRERASFAGYPSRVIEEFGRELARAAALRNRFYTPGFTDRMIRFGSRSPAVRQVLIDLVEGRQGYLALKRRLLGTLPRFLLESAVSVVTSR